MEIMKMVHKVIVVVVMVVVLLFSAKTMIEGLNDAAHENNLKIEEVKESGDIPCNIQTDDIYYNDVVLSKADYEAYKDGKITVLPVHKLNKDREILIPTENILSITIK